VFRPTSIKAIVSQEIGLAADRSCRYKSAAQLPVYLSVASGPGGIPVYVACSTLCFGRYPLERALRIIDELEFNKLDVAIDESGPHLKPSEVAADVSLAAQRIRIGPSLSPAAISVNFDVPTSAEHESQLRAVCHLARLSNVTTVTIGAALSDSSFEAEVCRLNHLAALTEREGVILCVESRMGTLTEFPDSTVELCRRAPGIGLTLDPSHYIAGPNQGRNYDCVFPYVRHVHLRDTGRGPNMFQVRVGQGEVEYGRLITQLARLGYNRLLTVEVQDIPDAPYQMDQEVRKLKYLLESLI
jgi:sugar phosphate isomerase/epimerase